MRQFIKSKRGLGTPVANLIVLTAAVMLSITVTSLAMNVTTSQVQKENLYITTSHLWYTNSSYSSGAIAVTNTGPTDIVLTKIVVKGLQCAWNGSTNFIIYNKTNQTLPGDLPYVATLTNTENNTIIVGNQPFTFAVAGEGLTLKSGWTIMFYLTIPDRVMVYDLGQPIRIVISTTQAVYCTETNVQTS
jgi:5'-3' exonuclease